ncbi:TPA: hypothetical protein SA910_000406 [Campylobacter jejuni]|nr:hypothetical protein [Campylobacter jejuni]
MKFSDFFHAWLHESYYKNAVSIGKNGDFFTAVSVGNLFGTLVRGILKRTCNYP